jgi:hypothetical protein
LQAEAALGFPETEPARAEGSPQQRGRAARGVGDGALGARKLPIDKLRRMKAEQRMRVAVIADFVAGGVDGAGDIRQALDVRADLKERGGRLVLVEQF